MMIGLLMWFSFNHLYHSILLCEEASFMDELLKDSLNISMVQ